MRKSVFMLGTMLACAALPVHAGGIQPGFTADTLEDIVQAASDAQRAAEDAAFADRIVVIAPPEPVMIAFEPLTAPAVVPNAANLVLTQTDERLIALFLLGGLAGLPLLLGAGGGSGGAGGVGGPALIGVPSNPGETPTPTPGVTTPTPTPGVTPTPTPTGAPTPTPTPLTPGPSPIPEPATWAMMLLGFAAVGGAMRRQGAGRRKGRTQMLSSTALLSSPPS